MRYTKFQKFLSSFLIFSLLSGITLRVPFFDFLASASGSEYYDLVSIIVDEETYSDIDSELERYSKDISNSLENTKVVILPVPQSATSYDIASMNESLFFEGYKSLSDVNFESKLVGTVLVGNLPTPLVYKNNEVSKTILPYTDFEDKSYIYNDLSGDYEFNKDNITGIKSEIWHGVISPNTGDDGDNINALKDYFDKNHDFYIGEGFYDLEKNSLNGNLNEGLSESYEPYVFYFDSFRESKSLNYNSYVGYQSYLANKEDIVYNRYTKELAEKLKKEILGNSTSTLSELAKKVDPTLSEEFLNSIDSNLQNVPDIQTRYIINNSVKKFVEIFSSGVISDMRKNVYNAGRFNYGEKVNADFIPYIISVLDIVNDEFIKEINDELEGKIDSLVKEIPGSIIIPVTYEYKDSLVEKTFENYLFGKKASDITYAGDCSFYRGSNLNGGQLVEANRGTNIYNIEPDENTLSIYGNICFLNLESGLSLEGLWGRNSPFNLNQTESSKGNLVLNTSDYRGAIVPLLDIKGSKEINDSSKIPNLGMCYDTNYLLADKYEYSENGESSIFKNTYKIPTFQTNSLRSSVPGWQCITDTNSPDKIYSFNIPYNQHVATLTAGYCEKNSIYLDGVLIKEVVYNEACGGDSCECSGSNSSTIVEDIDDILEGLLTDHEYNLEESKWIINKYNYKSIKDSHVFHKSPTPFELSAEIQSMITPSLPVDKDRYIDFLLENGSFAKINYPYLFRLKLSDISDLSLEKIKQELDLLLDTKSQEFNGIVSSGPRLDLKDYIKNKGTKEINIDGDIKEISYYDMLVFAIFWNNLNSVSAKYGFVFENYLSSQSLDDNNYFLPKNRSQYEIAYLGSKGNSSNMFIGLDPESKGINPYSDIILKNQDLSTKLFGLNIGGDNLNSNEKLFKCAPPEGVPIWEWIPAIMCRLGDMMPPTIKISDGACGPSLLTAEEKEELNSCNGDVNKNGVNDCIESKLVDGKITLESNSNKYSYNKTAKLKASLKGNDDRVLSFINSTKIYFELVKVEGQLDESQEMSASNKKVIYDINLKDEISLKSLDKYLMFKDLPINSTSGISNYGITFKDKDIDVYLRAKVLVKDSGNSEVINLNSNILKIEVRGDYLFSTSYNLSNISNGLVVNQSDSVIASDKTNIFIIDGSISNADNVYNLINNSSTSGNKLIFKIDNLSKKGTNLPINYPLNLSLYSNNVLLEELTIDSISQFKSLFSIKESGSYTLKIQDSLGKNIEKTFEVIPSNPISLDLNLGTNYLKSNGNISTNFVTILDKFGNPVSGEFYDLKMEIDGDSLNFLDNNSKILNSSTYEGYKIFRLKSLDEVGENKIIISLYDSNGNLIISTNKKLTVLEDFSIRTKLLNAADIKIGGGTYKYQIEVRDSSNNIINDFNSRIYIKGNSSYLDFYKPYFELVNGVGVAQFKTKTLAGKNIPLEIQIEGLGDIVTKFIDILPGLPMKLDMIISKSKFEANGLDNTIVNLELKDIYNNLVYNENSVNIDLEILPEYRNIIKSDTYSSVIKDGKTSFKIYGTKTPGIGYFKFSTRPLLDSNVFLLEDESGDISISGYGETAGKIETFYVWNKSKIEKGNYNSIYTTLLGSDYGDIDQKDYLAGSIIFDKNSKALAVTSIINNPYLHNNIFSLSNKGGFTKLYSDNDLSQDIKTEVSFKNSKLYIDIFNNSINTHIGEVYYLFPNNTDLKVCGDEFDCSNVSKTSILGKSTDSDFAFYKSNGNLILNDKLGKTYLEIDKSGNIIRKSNIEFSLISSSSNNLELKLKFSNKEVGLLSFSFVESNLSLSRDISSFETKLNTSKNSILVYLDSSFYGSYTSGKGENESLIIYYNDPFGSPDSLNNFSRSNNFGYENFVEKGGLGWSNGNKTLLSFSSGKTVGESLKENMSFSSINIGDPVISLKKIKKKFNDTNIFKKFDSTIGDVISNESGLDGYKILDYNNDSRDDILLIKNDGYLKLLENVKTESRFLDLGNLAYIVDSGSHELLQTGDFTGDGYDDIFFVGEDGKPYILNNINKDFSRLSLSNKFNLNGRIIRAESFDMDNDTIDDIITLDDSGEINIFYGILGSGVNPNFTKLNLTDEYGVTLNSEIRKDGGFVYYDGLYQLDSTYDNSDLLESNLSYLENLKNSLNSGSELDYGERVDEDLANSLIFEQISYSKNYNSVILDPSDLNSLTILPESIEQTTFIKSYYSESAGVKVEKTFKDRNGGYLSKGDYIDVEIKVTNVANRNLNDFAYIEDVLEYFTLDELSITNNKDLDIKVPNNSYDFLIDNFTLFKNDTLKINYSGIVKPIKYSYMQVGLFEKGEEGDDLYGDILLKDSNENCGLPVEIFRSVSTRLYSKGVKNPICDTGVLPEELVKNTIDTNGNGIPDYIEELTTNNEALRDYSQDNLNSLFQDSDGDGIPDDEDSFNSGDLLDGNLGSIGNKIDSGLDNIQNILNALSCGFNNGACISTPLNWAPLAPGGDPTFMGYPIGDGLHVNEGIPIFSSLTWRPSSRGCRPTVWPVSPLGIGCTATSAGGILGTRDASNTFRLFVTPTLTGGVGVAACFGGPAIVAGYSNPPGLAPLFPGGNCIVVAKPILKCSNDGSEGNPATNGIPIYGNEYGVLNGNCSINTESYIDQNYVNNYYNYINGNGSSYNLGNINEAISDHSSNSGGPLFYIGADSGTPVSVSIDPESGDVDFSDITKMVKKRIQSFPGFLMNWVTRQIEEIVNKLTDFPTLFIILPDFSGIYDTDLDWDSNKKNWLKNSGNSNSINNEVIDIDTSIVDSETLDGLSEKAKKYNSGIKEAYEFIGSLPLVTIEQSPVDISVPWISLSEIDKSILTRKLTLDSWKTELERAKNSWSLGTTCNFENQAEQTRCEENNSAGNKIILDSSNLINSLERNLEVLKSYKEIPENINKLLNTKEKYLEQILCNIDTISYVLGGRIGKNGERFKAWVELFILIKAILKSWQLLIDVFVEYEQECKECKNERQDLLNFEFELISMIIPKIPVIEFPKWPDIILDLHNIRAGLNILLPEFNINARPILLPELPNLYLPDAPNVNISLPSLPLLPELVIPELPDLPTLPTVELPDLPPPPTLPKMLAALEGILDILKLITKAMCILKSSPFHPEWRAGDQIAFLTERNGYLWSDFLSISNPHFSFPWIDAIKVTTYVNLEFEVDFITELARQIAMPINNFNSDFTNMFNIDIADLDFRGFVPSEINVDLGQNETNLKAISNSNDGLDKFLVYLITKNLLLGSEYISKNKEITVSNQDFKKEVSKSLADKDFISDPRFDDLRSLWKNVENYTFSGENKVINELKENNFNKFETLKDIINTEIIKNKEFKSDFNNSLKTPIRKVSLVKDSNIEEYNSMLDKYNSKVFEKTSSIVNSNGNNIYKEELKNIGDGLLSKVDTALNKYKNASDSIKKTKLLAANTETTSASENSCNLNSVGSGDYSYVYEGIYIIENERSYRLFDYKDELLGNEKTTIIDFDGDNDEDLLYFVNNSLYLKENLENKPVKTYLNESPIILESDDNKFLNGSTYISSINNAVSTNGSSGIIDLSFSSKNFINNYRLSFYTLIDKFINEDFSNYTPKFKKKSIIDAISGDGEINLVSDNEFYKTLKDIVSIKGIGNYNGLKVETYEFVNILDDIRNGNVVNLSNGTKIYSGDSVSVLKYSTGNGSETKSIIIPKNQHLEIKSNLNVVDITGNGYIRKGNTKIYSGTEVRNLIGLPLLFGTKISNDDNNSNIQDNSYIDLEYYDGSNFSIDFKNVLDWELYDLGYESNKYLISSIRKNDFYYSKIEGYKNNIISTSSNQILLAPQIHSDSNSPELSLSSIRVPVYQKQNIDLTKYFYEDSGISSFYIDFDLSKDNNLDGNFKNDDDSSNMDNLNIIKVDGKIYLEVGPFTKLYNKKIGFTIIDINGNIGYKELNFIVYPPIPNVIGYENNIVSGELDEDLNKEPVNIYRVRGGMVSKLTTSNGSNGTLTDVNGDFTFEVGDNSSGIKVFKNGVNIANIDDKTGKITIISNDGILEELDNIILGQESNNYTIDILSSNDSNNEIIYPKIILKDTYNDIFYESIKVKGNKIVNVVSDFDSIENSGVYFKLINTPNYGYYTLPENVSYNPGSLVVYNINDTTKNPIFTIFNDGRINTKNSNYILKYNYFNNYVVIYLYDKIFGRDIGSVLYKVDSDYIIK